MIENKKVSVIVPIYKVEKYIRRCVDSIITQTYSNLEIILVDDGSPDKCGEIADQYCKQDKRIKVIHKENGGLSDARNFGVKEVTGDYVLFIDSDDWIADKMVDIMVDHMLEYEADVVQAAFYYAYEDKLLFDNRYYNETYAPVILDNKELIYELVVNERVKNFAWGKLYKAELIQDISFRVGVLFEDVFWAHHVMRKVNSYVMVHQPLYYYLQRQDSIVSTYTPRNLDIIEGLKERHQFIERHYEYLINESYKGLLKMSLIHYNLLLRNIDKDSGGQHRKVIQSYIRNNYEDIKHAVKDDKELSRQLSLFMINPYVNFLFLAVRKVLRKIRMSDSHTGLKWVEL